MAGTLFAWVLPEAWTGRPMSVDTAVAAWSQAGSSLPAWAGGDLAAVLSQSPELWLGFLSVVIPMGLFNVIGSLQNIESAEAGGDAYSTGSSLAANGVGTIIAALLGSCFPTTIYIGHPGWKGMGARAGYSTLNGFVVTIICLTGTVALVGSLVPIEAGMAIVLWIGIVITAQAFQATPREHAPAAAIGLFPAIAAWGATIAIGSFTASGGKTMAELMTANPKAEVGGFLLHGLMIMEHGFIFTCMVLAAMAACLIDRRFYTAGVWAMVGALVTATGLAHSYQLSGNSVTFLPAAFAGAEGAIHYRANDLAIGYVLMGLVFFVFGLYVRNRALDQCAHETP